MNIVLRRHPTVSNMISNNNKTRRVKDKQVIRIITWTPPIHNWFKTGRGDFSKCATPIPCEYSNQSSYNSSDVIMINAFYLRHERDMPPFRLPHQKWLFYHTEAPRHDLLNFSGLTRYHSLFNLTLTYSSDADIVKPYGVCLPNRETIKKHPSSITDYIRTVYGTLADTAPWLSQEKPYVSYNRAAGKSRLVAWMVSRCAAASKRREYVNLLQRYIPVDIYGKCGNHTCLPKFSTKCEHLLNTTYKFYLAFENSLCPEYITEKVWLRLKEDVVPIVLGGAEYEKYLPKHSYINIKDFSSPRELAKYLTILNKNDTLYNEYFHWKKDYTCYGTPPSMSMACSICRHANKFINKIEIAPNIAEFWSVNKCMSPKEFYRGVADIVA